MENFIILFHYTLFYAELHKVFMKTDDCSQKDRQVIHRLKKTERLYEKDWKQVITNESEWQDKWQQVVKWVTTSDNEQQRVTTNDNEWKLNCD